MSIEDVKQKHLSCQADGETDRGAAGTQAAQWMAARIQDSTVAGWAGDSAGVCVAASEASPTAINILLCKINYLYLLIFVNGFIILTKEIKN